MGVVDDDVEFLVAAADRLIDQLAHEFKRRTNDTGRGDALAAHAKRTLEAVKVRVDGQKARLSYTGTDYGKATVARNLRFYSSLAWGVHETLPWLEGAVHPLDLGIVFLIDEAARAIVGVPVDIVPVESGDYMYWTFSWPFADVWAKHLGGWDPEGARPIVLAYPPRESASALLHANFAHELGHSAADEYDYVATVATPLIESAAYNARLDALIASAGPTQARRLRVKLEKRVQDWIEELLCDQLALAYLGPGFLFSFAGMVLPVTWNEPQDVHPNATMRIGFLVRAMQARGWEQLIEQEVSGIWGWLVAAADVPSLDDPHSAFVRESCAIVEKEIRAVAEERLGDALFDAESYRACGGKLVELLTNDILPAQLDQTTAADHRQILLAAWLQVLGKYGGTPAAIPKALREHDYQRFIAKAIEMSTTFKIWREVRSR